MDAINWFGDAATDPNASSSMVKYVSAIARLLFASFKPGRKKFSAKRVGGVLRAFGCDDGRKVHEQALEVYDIRSVLVHGEYHEVTEGLDKAAVLSRMCLLCSFQRYLQVRLVFGQVDPAKLDEIIERVGKEGVDGLFWKAGRPMVESTDSCGAQEAAFWRAPHFAIASVAKMMTAAWSVKTTFRIGRRQKLSLLE